MAGFSELDPLAVRLRQPDLQRLLSRLVARLRQGRPLVGRLRLRAPSQEERRAVAALLGGGMSASHQLSVDLMALSVLATRDGRFVSLRSLVEAAHGRPVEDERARRQSQHGAWNALWQKIAARASRWTPVLAWLEAPSTRGSIRRCSGGDVATANRLLDSLFAVLDRLPAAEPIALAQLAAEAVGDSHALDADNALGRIAARCVAAWIGRERPRRASALRATWSAAGVVMDELAASVLALNLPAHGGTHLGDVLALHRRDGVPCRVTFRQLNRQPDCRFDRSGGEAVYVCENPSVLAAAAGRWASRCRPLVCVEGQPNLAAEQLLRMLKSQGFRLRYHGDFDWGGVRIATRLWHLFGFEPWRFRDANYRSAPPGRRLTGKPSATPWDAELRRSMEELETAVHEEAVVFDLLSDLGP